MSALEASELTVAYAGHPPAVTDVSITLEPGRITGLTGESGSGKSTLALTLAGYRIPGSFVLAGEVRFGGVELLALSPARLRELWGAGIAYLPQDAATALNPALRIGGQITETLRAHLSLGRDAARERAATLLTRVGLADPESMLDRYPHQLSGGEQQRVALALAVACEPSVLILDEPTTGLDGRTQALVVGLIARLTRELETATLLISHDLPLLGSVCDELLVISAGEVVERGPAAEIAARGARLPGGPAPSRVAPTAREAVLAVDSLRCSYGRTVAVDGATFEVAPGRMLGIAGESGSGKTTVLRAVAGIVSPDAGSVVLDGRPLAAKRSREERRAIQIVFQNPDATLNPRHKVMKALERPLKLFRPDVARAGRRGEASATLERIGLAPELLDRLPHELSAGQRQRVAIARAVIARPRVLLCDEVTSALDWSSQAAVVELLDELRREQDLAVVFVSHDLGLLDQVAHETLVLGT